MTSRASTVDWLETTLYMQQVGMNINYYSNNFDTRSLKILSWFTLPAASGFIWKSSTSIFTTSSWPSWAAACTGCSPFCEYSRNPWTLSCINNVTCAVCLFHVYLIDLCWTFRVHSTLGDETPDNITPSILSCNMDGTVAPLQSSHSWFSEGYEYKF